MAKDYIYIELTINFKTLRTQGSIFSLITLIIRCWHHVYITNKKKAIYPQVNGKNRFIAYLHPLSF